MCFCLCCSLVILFPSWRGTSPSPPSWFGCRLLRSFLPLLSGSPLSFSAAWFLAGLFVHVLAWLPRLSQRGAGLAVQGQPRAGCVPSPAQRLARRGQFGWWNCTIFPFGIHVCYSGAAVFPPGPEVDSCCPTVALTVSRRAAYFSCCFTQAAPVNLFLSRNFTVRSM